MGRFQVKTLFIIIIIVKIPVHFHPNIPQNNQMQKFTKSFQNKLKHLTSLTYPKLLSELINDRKNNPHYDMRQCVNYLKFSTQHECENLFFLSQYMEGKLRRKGGFGNNDVSDLTVMWYEISKRGMATIYDSIYDCRLMNKLTPQQQQQHYDRTLNYIKQLPKVLQKPTLATNSSQKFLELLSYTQPPIFDTTHYSYNEQQMLKQEYILTLEKLCRLGGDNFVESMITTGGSFGGLFPVELFNLTDQPLIRDLYLKYVYPSLINSISLNSSQAIFMISRFNLPYESYIINQLSKIKQQADNIPQKQILQNLNIYNTLFIIYRKFGIQNQHNSSVLHEKIKKQIYQIVGKLKLNHMLKNISNDESNTDQVLNNFVKNLVDKAVGEALKDEASVIDLQNQLYECSGVKGIRLNFYQNQYDLLKFLVKNKIVRFLILTAHIYLQSEADKNNEKHLNNITKLINSCKPIIQSSITFGDLLPELIYLNDKWNRNYGKNILEPQIQSLIANARAKYCDLIKKIEQKEQLKQLGQSLDDHHQIWNRVNCSQYLLSSCSRLVLSNTITKFMNKNYFNLSQKNIIQSLTNDNQFLSTFPTKLIKSTIYSHLQLNLELTCQKQKIYKNYPYLPSIAIEYQMRPKNYLYFQDNLCRQTRIRSQKDIVIDITDEKSLGRIKSIRKYPERYLPK